MSKRTMKTERSSRGSSLTGSGMGSAQQAGLTKPPAFEAASIKPNTSGDWRRAMGPAPGGRFTATNVPSRDLIAYAYGISQDSVSFRIVGGPKWIDEDRFDVNAVVTGAWTPPQMREMLRTLMADRFRLAAHADTREMPTYTLALVPNQPLVLRRSVVDEAACRTARSHSAARGRPAARAGRAAYRGARTIPARSPPSAAQPPLASTLGQFVSRSVVDRATGRPVRLRAEVDARHDAAGAADAPPLNVDPNGPSIFTALQEQLGLKRRPTA
jgi:uncharacterized protein (TIGR03435 family)